MTTAEINRCYFALATEGLGELYRKTRKFTEQLCRPLATDDYGLQGMTDVSPPKWHLAHVSWFFENFILRPFVPNYKPFDESFLYVFNSYYQSSGKIFDRSNRGLLSRPTVAQVYDYRFHVDECMSRFLLEHADNPAKEISDLVTLGIHHEQQHQELLLMDIKYNFAQNPLFPVYLRHKKAVDPSAGDILRFAEDDGSATWLPVAEGHHLMGFQGEGFCFDNELPPHKIFLPRSDIRSRLVTNGEYIQFIENGAYEDPLLWLSDGWEWVRKNKLTAPLYWQRDAEDQWSLFTLHGLQAADLQAPVCHVNYFEADAFARWAGCRLPTEQEWEAAARDFPYTGHLLAQDKATEALYLEPLPADEISRMSCQFYGDVWEWTSSAYHEYPGFRPFTGAASEYNGKFMCNQMVLRGGSSLTPQDHIRATYRNFFPPQSRWQMSGIRLARRS
jgi:ergothioneine biosynthesis protein EgtB